MGYGIITDVIFAVKVHNSILPYKKMSPIM